MLNKNIWKSIKNNIQNRYISKKDLNKKQNREYDIIKNIAQKLIIDNFSRNPPFSYIRKSPNGFKINFRCFFQYKRVCNWNVNIDINTKESIISCDSECKHENPNRKKSKHFLFIAIFFCF